MASGKPSTCWRCDTPVSWWRNANSREGEEKWLCVDRSSDDNGYVQKMVNGKPGEKPTIWGRVLTDSDLADAISAGELLFTLHSRTCSRLNKPNPKPEGLEIDWSAAQRRNA